MRCTDKTAGPVRRALGMALGAVGTLSTLGVLSGCSSPTPSAPAPVVTARPAPTTPAAPATPPAPQRPAAPPVAAAPGPAPVAPVARTPLPPMAVARNWDEFRTLAARRLVAANPQHTYMGTPPEPLLAIPVLEVELNGDGSVRRIDVLRHPTQARDTVQLAIDAVHRAAPFSEVSRLPRPWKFSEVFLYDDNRRFKPRTLDR